MNSHGGDPWLLTPGPLTTSSSVKEAMLRDLGSRDAEFIALTRRIRDRLVGIVDDSAAYRCVPLQGSGTYAVEAMLGSLLPRRGRLLNVVNGAYGRRITRICEYLERDVSVLEFAEERPVDAARVDQALRDDPGITHVSVVHCETTSGILNPLPEIMESVSERGRRLLVDAMSSFGALPVSLAGSPVAGLAASANKCLEGVPGLAFCIVRMGELEHSAGNAHSLSLDLYEQWRGLEGNGQWRFTPPTHCLLALDQALDEFDAEGGVAGRGSRYRDNCRILVEGMRALGFRTLIDDACQAPIIVTFHMPADPAFRFEDFYEGLRRRGYVIYPGKLTDVATFRIGCIGRLGTDEMKGAVAAVASVIEELGVRNCSPRGS